MNKRKKKTASASEPMTVAEVQSHAELAQQRSRLLIETYAFLGGYLGSGATPPERLLQIDGIEVEADRRLVEELRGELLVAASLANRRRRELMGQPLAEAVDVGVDPLFEETA